MIFYTFIGVALYVFRIWFKWSNRVDAGVEDKTFKQELHEERQEIAVAIAGAFLFIISGDGVLDSCCDILEYFFNGSHDVCTSIQVNMEELFYVIGGASFGSVLLFAVKMLKEKAKRKLES